MKQVKVQHKFSNGSEEESEVNRNLLRRNESITNIIEVKVLVREEEEGRERVMEYIESSFG